MTSSPQSRSDVWFSYNAVTGPKTCTWMPLYTLSIALDDASWKGVSDLRLIVVRKPRENDPEMLLRECNTLEPFHKWTNYHLNPPRGLPKPTPTNRLRSSFVAGAREEMEHGKAPIVVVLEYAAPSSMDHADYRTGAFSLRPVRVTSLLDIKPDLRVLFNRTYRLSEDGHCIFLVLTSTNLRQSDYKTYHDLTMRNAYSLRILPLLRGRPSPISTFPLSILVCITNLAINHYETSWAKELLNYGLVQRSWVPLLELFWDQIGSGSGYVANPSGMTKCIIRRPEMGKYLIRHCSDLIAHYHLSDEVYAAAHRSLLLVAKNLQVLSMNTHCFNVVKDLLPSLKGVRKLECYCYDRNGRLSCTIEDLQGLIKGWSSLEEISLAFLGASPDDSSEPAISPYAAYSLKSFVVGTGTLSGKNLLRFFTNPNQRLSRLRLHGVTGLTNEDFCSLFGITSSTLESIHIELCRLVEPSVHSDRALDLHLPDMPSIKEITVQDLSTVRAISSKPGLRSGQLSIINADPITYFESEHLTTESEKARSLLTAIEHSNWSRIEFMFTNSQGLTASRWFSSILSEITKSTESQASLQVAPCRFSSHLPTLRVVIANAD